METATRRNIYAFGLGTIGRDMVYAMVTMYLIFYLTDFLGVSDATLWWINGIILLARIFDAANDPVMGVIVDNTRTKYGKFKPWIAFRQSFPASLPCFYLPILASGTALSLSLAYSTSFGA